MHHYMFKRVLSYASPKTIMTLPSELCFIDVLIKRIYLLLREKEENAMTGDMARRWLSDEAASVVSVNRIGTFR